MPETTSNGAASKLSIRDRIRAMNQAIDRVDALSPSATQSSNNGFDAPAAAAPPSSSSSSSRPRQTTNHDIGAPEGTITTTTTTAPPVDDIPKRSSVVDIWRKRDTSTSNKPPSTAQRVPKRSGATSIAQRWQQQQQEKQPEEEQEPQQQQDEQHRQTPLRSDSWNRSQHSNDSRRGTPVLGSPTPPPQPQPQLSIADMIRQRNAGLKGNNSAAPSPVPRSTPARDVEIMEDNTDKQGGPVTGYGTRSNNGRVGNNSRNNSSDRSTSFQNYRLKPVAATATPPSYPQESHPDPELELDADVESSDEDPQPTGQAPPVRQSVANRWNQAMIVSKGSTPSQVKGSTTPSWMKPKLRVVTRDESGTPGQQNDSSGVDTPRSTYTRTPSNKASAATPSNTGTPGSYTARWQPPGHSPANTQPSSATRDDSADRSAPKTTGPSPVSRSSPWNTPAKSTPAPAPTPPAAAGKPAWMQVKLRKTGHSVGTPTHTGTPVGATTTTTTTPTHTAQSDTQAQVAHFEEDHTIMTEPPKSTPRHQVASSSSSVASPERRKKFGEKWKRTSPKRNKTKSSKFAIDMTTKEEVDATYASPSYPSNGGVVQQRFHQSLDPPAQSQQQSQSQQLPSDTMNYWKDQDPEVKAEPEEVDYDDDEGGITHHTGSGNLGATPRSRVAQSPFHPFDGESEAQESDIPFGANGGWLNQAHDNSNSNNRNNDEMDGARSATPKSEVEWPTGEDDHLEAPPSPAHSAHSAQSLMKKQERARTPRSSGDGTPRNIDVWKRHEAPTPEPKIVPSFDKIRNKPSTDSDKSRSLPTRYPTILKGSSSGLSARSKTPSPAPINAIERKEDQTILPKVPRTRSPMVELGRRYRGVPGFSSSSPTPMLSSSPTPVSSSSPTPVSSSNETAARTSASTFAAARKAMADRAAARERTPVSNNQNDSRTGSYRNSYEKDETPTTANKARTTPSSSSSSRKQQTEKTRYSSPSAYYPSSGGAKPTGTGGTPQAVSRRQHNGYPDDEGEEPGRIMLRPKKEVLSPTRQKLSRPEGKKKIQQHRMRIKQSKSSDAESDVFSQESSHNSRDRNLPKILLPSDSLSVEAYASVDKPIASKPTTPSAQSISGRSFGPGPSYGSPSHNATPNTSGFGAFSPYSPGSTRSSLFAPALPDETKPDSSRQERREKSSQKPILDLSASSPRRAQLMQMAQTRLQHKKKLEARKTREFTPSSEGGQSELSFFSAASSALSPRSHVSGTTVSSKGSALASRAKQALHRRRHKSASNAEYAQDLTRRVLSSGGATAVTTPTSNARYDRRSAPSSRNTDDRNAHRLANRYNTSDRFMDSTAASQTQPNGPPHQQYQTAPPVTNYSFGSEMTADEESSTMHRSVASSEVSESMAFARSRSESTDGNRWAVDPNNTVDANFMEETTSNISALQSGLRGISLQQLANDFTEEVSTGVNLFASGLNQLAATAGKNAGITRSDSMNDDSKRSGHTPTLAEKGDAAKDQQGSYGKTGGVSSASPRTGSSRGLDNDAVHASTSSRRSRQRTTSDTGTSANAPTSYQNKPVPKLRLKPRHHREPVEELEEAVAIEVEYMGDDDGDGDGDDAEEQSSGDKERGTRRRKPSGRRPVTPTSPAGQSSYEFVR